MARTKIELNPAFVRRISGLDDIARILFPDNKNHQRAFIAIWLEIKYADGQFLPSCRSLPGKYDVTQRTFEIVRAKMKKLGLIRRVSHFSPEYGYRAGWVFSERFGQALWTFNRRLRDATTRPATPVAAQKDHDSLRYV